LINEKNQFVAQVCHIEAAEPGGQRFNRTMTDEERRSYDNLTLMCYRHHKETDDVQEFPVERLRAIKHAHEVAHGDKPFKINEAHLHKLAHEMEQYWTEIRDSVAQQMDRWELAMGVSADSDFTEVLNTVRAGIDGLESCCNELARSMVELPDDLISFLKRLGVDTVVVEDTPYYENPFENREWGIRALAIPNLLKSLRMDLCHLEIKFLEEYLVTHNDDLPARTKMNRLKAELRHLIETTVRND
jgi:hypothetical protein